VAPPKTRDLGSGVHLSTAADGSLRVQSAALVMPWSVRSGKVSGTAVLVGDGAFEVVGRQRSGSGDLWTLQPWPTDAAMRAVFTLDEAWVSGRAHERALDRRAGRLRAWLLPLMPLLGFVPAALQSSWEKNWGFAATTATTLSAVGELAVASVGIVHVLASAFGGSGILPRAFSWLGLVAPILAVEGVVRLKHVAAAREPIGSALLMPLSVLAPKRAVPPAPWAPVVRDHDPDRGRLQLQSPIYRADWALGGLLAYRGERFELTSVAGEGRDWIYTFAQVGEQARGDTLRLRPPPSRPSPVVRERPPGVLRTTLVTALACLAPRDLQESWSRRIDAPAVLLTVLGAGAECFGALVNLASSDLLLVNLYLLAEGAIRFGLLIGTGRPVGSLAGLALRPALEPLMLEDS
jgi:hypothetical protein